MALRVTTEDENESLRLPHPCALVAASHLLNTTWSLKLPYKAAWEYRDEKNHFIYRLRLAWFWQRWKPHWDRPKTRKHGKLISIPEERGSASPSWATSSALAAPFVNIDDARRLEGTNSKGSVDADVQLHEMRSEMLRLGDVVTKTNASQRTTATHRRKQ
jgi:hypothetical protein